MWSIPIVVWGRAILEIVFHIKIIVCTEYSSGFYSNLKCKIYTSKEEKKDQEFQWLQCKCQ